MALMALAENTKRQGMKRRVYIRLESTLYDAAKIIGEAFRKLVISRSEITIAAPSANGAAFGNRTAERQEASAIDSRDLEDQAAPTTGLARR